MSEPSGRFIVKSLGCKANLYDAQQIETELRRRGWVPLEGSSAGEGPLLCIVNSCTVTDEADRQSRRMASRLARENPEAHVVVTGCAAEVDPERLSASKGIDYVIGNQDKPRLVELVLSRIADQGAKPREPSERGGEVLGSARGYAEILSRHPMDREWPEPWHLVREGEDAVAQSAQPMDKTRAFLKIQEGCNSFCTYCIIPYGRGPSRSLRPRETLEAVRGLVAHGVKELVLTGTNLGDYALDWTSSDEKSDQLCELIRLILEETDLARLRLSSLDPTEISDSLLELMEREPRLCPHFHVSLQSPLPRVLRAMKRRYGYEEARACLEKISRLRAPMGGVFVGMDVIAGFPGETEDEFEWGLERLGELPWTRLHVFPYSEREGTPATRLPGSVARGERARRARVLSALSFERMSAHHASIVDHCAREGRALDQVLLERASKPPVGLGSDGKAWAAGYTANYLRVFVPEPSPGALRNRIVSVRPEHLSLDRVNGDVAIVGMLSGL